MIKIKVVWAWLRCWVYCKRRGLDMVVRKDGHFTYSIWAGKYRPDLNMRRIDKVFYDRYKQK